MNPLSVLCTFGLHAWNVEHDGEVPGARVYQRYCPRCGTEQVTYEVYDYEAWQQWVMDLEDNRIPESTETV